MEAKKLINAKEKVMSENGIVLGQYFSGADCKNVLLGLEERISMFQLLRDHESDKEVIEYFTRKIESCQKTKEIFQWI